MCGTRVSMLAMLWGLSSFPSLFDLASHPPHGFFLGLHARWLPLHVFFSALPAVAPILSSVLLLVDFDALPELF